MDASATYEWDGSTWTLMNTGGPSRRTDAALAYDSRLGRTVAFGGNLAQGNVSGELWQWDAHEWTLWNAGSGPAPAARAGAAMAYDPVRDRLVVFGGSADTSNSCNAMDGRTSAGSFGDTWEWDGTKWSNRTADSPQSPPVRAYASMVYDSSRGVMVLTGGSSASCDNLTDVWEWDGTSWHDTTPSSVAPSASRGAATTYDSGRGRTVLFGGADESGKLLQTTLEWNGAAWRDLTPPAGNPPPRVGHSLAYDSDRGRTVLFGGGGHLAVDGSGTPTVTSLFSDTWEWDGKSWTAIPTPQGAPPARWGAAMVYDAARHVTMLFGGCCDSGGNAYADVWTWNGTTWTKLNPSGMAPVGRYMHAMAYDSDRKVTVLFGGTVDPTQCGDGSDTWEWNGSRWSYVNVQPGSCGDANTPPCPAPYERYGHLMTYDPVRGRTLLVGGTQGQYGRCRTITDNFWEWDGTLWTQPSVSDSPPPALGLPASTLTYDTGRQRAVLITGGATSVWESPSEPARRAAAIAEFAFGAAGDPAATIEKLTFDTHAAGCGNSNVVPGEGRAIPGATVAAWDAAQGAWREEASNSTAGDGCASTLTSPTPLHVELTGADASRLLLSGSQALHFAVYSSAGWGNGEFPPRSAVDVTPMELTVQYRASAGSYGPCGTTSSTQCQTGLTCVTYAEGSDDGVCLPPCSSDSMTCPQSTACNLVLSAGSGTEGVCGQDCTTASCPEGTTCQTIQGGPICWPGTPPPTLGYYDLCSPNASTLSPCGSSMFCAQFTGFNAGLCTASCNSSADCPKSPAPSVCVDAQCYLDCSSKACPAGTTCQDTDFGSLCGIWQ